MLESVKELTEIAFIQMNLKRIKINCESTNLKSRSIPDRRKIKKL